MMTVYRQNQLTLGKSELSLVEKLLGFHACPDWDGLVIGPQMEHRREWEICSCMTSEMKRALELEFRRYPVTNQAQREGA